MPWDSKHFTRQEFACPCSDCAPFPEVRPDLLQTLDDAREEFDCPIYVTSGFRCSSWNKKIGGHPRSMHLLNPVIAVDIAVRNYSPEDVFDYLDTRHRNALGLGLYNSHVHVDVRHYPSRWDHRRNGQERSESD